MAECSGKTSLKAGGGVEPYRLLADIGGTFARFAVQQPGKPIRKSRRYCCADFPNIVAAVRTYYHDAKIGQLPVHAAFAVAAPITGDMVRMTNHPWNFSITGIGRALGAATIVVNDFLAIAESIPLLTPDQTRKIGLGTPAPHAPIAVIGPGTGFGVGALVPVRNDSGSGLLWHAIATEGGHASLAANSARENAVIERLRRRYSQVSIEHCLAGQGLINLYGALAEVEGKTAALNLSPPDITGRARKSDPLAREAITMFCAMLGATAGDLALTFGARGGVYIAGGIVPKLGALFDAKLFRRRFTAKDRYRDYLRPIPTYLITHPVPALIGLAALLDRRAGAAIDDAQVRPA